MKVSRALVVLFLASMLSLSIGCGGGDGDGGGGGGGALPSGTFVKTAIVADDSDNLFPFYTSAQMTLQQLYHASEVNGAGYLQRISFRRAYNELSVVTCASTTIKLGHTLSTAVVGTYANNVENGKGSLQTVIDAGTITIPAGNAGEYFDIPLDTPFYYNGVDNLIVEFRRGAACSSTVELDLTTNAAENRQANSLDLGTTAAATGTYLRLAKFHFKGGTNTVITKDQTGDNANTIAPGATGRTQMLILASDITGTGLITGMAIQPDVATALGKLTGVTVVMAHSPATTTDLSSDFATNLAAASGAATVVSNLTFTMLNNRSEPFWIPFNNGTFNYNGSSNILVDIVVTSTTATFSIDYKNVPNIRTVTSIVPTATTGTTRMRSLQPTFRFKGGTIDVLTDAGSTTMIIPVGGGLEFIVQMLYDNMLLGSSGTVKAVSFRLGMDANPFDHTDVNLVLGHTTLSALGAPSLAANITSNRTAVFSGTISIPAGMKAGDWVTVPLTSSFGYQASKNLVVQWDVPAYAAQNPSMSDSGSSGAFVGHVMGNIGDRTSDLGTAPGAFVQDLRLTIQ